MMRYKLYIADVLRDEGTEDEANLGPMLFNGQKIETEDDLRACIEGKAIGIFMNEYIHDPIFPSIKAMTEKNYLMGVGLTLSVYQDFYNSVRIEIEKGL